MRRLAFTFGRSLGQAALVAAGVVVVTFLLVHVAPGDPAQLILGNRATPQALATLRAELGLNHSLPVDFALYVRHLVDGSFGQSIYLGNRSVGSIIAPDLLVTLSVIGATLLISVVVGTVIGLWAALSRRRVVDGAVRFVAVTLLAIPTFLVGLLLIFFLALRAHIAPAGGWGSGWPSNFRYLWLPATALSCYLTPIVIRAVRQSAREIEAQPFVEAVLVRGIPPWKVVVRHVLPNSVLPLLTLIGYNVAALITGAVVVEAVFGIPGLGTALVLATERRDYPVVQGIALVTGLLVVGANLLTDAAYALVDPRLRAR